MPSLRIKYLLPLVTLLPLFACAHPTSPSPPKTYDELAHILEFAIKQKDTQTFLDQLQGSPRVTPENENLIYRLEKNGAKIYVTDIYPFFENKHVLYPKAEKFVWIISSDGDPEKVGVSTLTLSFFAYTTNGIIKIRPVDPATDTSNNTHYEFAIVVKDRSKLLKNLGEPHPRASNRSWDGRFFSRFSMADFADMLSRYTGFRVTDETGISGDYDFNPHIRDINNPAITRIALQAFGLDLVLPPTR